MTSQQAAAMLHAAGVTGDHQQVHYCGIADDGDEGYTAAVVLLEAAGLVGQHYTATGKSGEYDVMRFETENGSVTVTAPNGSVERFRRRLVMTPSEHLAGCALCSDDCVEVTPLGRSTMAGLKARAAAHVDGELAWRDGQPHDEAAS